MNVHYHISAYHLRAAVKHAYRGVRKDLAPVVERVNAYYGEEDEEELGRRGRVEGQVRAVEYRARREAAEARERVGRVRARLG